MTFWWALAKRFWPAIVGTLALLAAYLWHVGEIKEARADERQKVTLAYQEALREVITEREQIREAKDREWQAKLDRLNRRSLSIDPGVIRVCVAPPSLAASDATGELDGSASGGRQDLSVGPDIGRSALVLATECERDRAKLVELQDWVKSQNGTRR